MEAKDTVMNDSAEISYWGRGSMWKWNIHDLKESLFNQCNHKWIDHNIDNLLLCQAEISFRAGIREVVKWIEEHGGSLDGFRPEWQAFLKEKGVLANGEH